MMYYGLADCNSFYCSAERVFNVDARHRPVVVLSNQDMCLVAFSRDAKALGFGEMCEPFHLVKDKIKKHNVAVFSSNYTLYDDISKRVMKTLANFTPELEVYSVDEAFLRFQNFESIIDLHEYAKEIKDRVMRDTGIPIGMGISKTKVLAKLANKISKTTGTCVLLNDEDIDRAMKNFPVKDIWGIGSASSRKLNSLGVYTAYDLKMYRNESTIQRLLTKVGREIQDELRGIPCLSLEKVEDKKIISNSRSFSSYVLRKNEMKEAVATFAAHCAEKMRRQKSVCYSLSVYMHTNSFMETPQYYGYGSSTFQTGTDDTVKVIRAAHKVVDEIFRGGFEYKKAGVIFNHIVPKSQNQTSFFDEGEDKEDLNKVMDEINRRFGTNTIYNAACGGDNTSWRLIQRYKSKRFTTCWDELLVVNLPSV